MTDLNANETLAFHSTAAQSFHASYMKSPNRRERLSVWRKILDVYIHNTNFVYDLGCGTGLLACEIAARARHVVAIDGSKGMLDIATLLAQQQRLSNVEFRLLQLPDGLDATMPKADIVVSSSALEYLPSLGSIFRAIKLIVRDRGIFVFSMSNALSLSRTLVRLVHCLTGRPRYLTFLKHFVRIDIVRHELEEEGFTLLSSSYFEGSDRLNRALGFLLPVQYTNNMIVFIARYDGSASSDTHSFGSQR